MHVWLTYRVSRHCNGAFSGLCRRMGPQRAYSSQNSRIKNQLDHADEKNTGRNAQAADPRARPEPASSLDAKDAIAVQADERSAPDLLLKQALKRPSIESVQQQSMKSASAESEADGSGATSNQIHRDGLVDMIKDKTAPVDRTDSEPNDTIDGLEAVSEIQVQPEGITTAPPDLESKDQSQTQPDSPKTAHVLEARASEPAPQRQTEPLSRNVSAGSCSTEERQEDVDETDERGGQGAMQGDDGYTFELAYTDADGPILIEGTSAADATENTVRGIKEPADEPSVDQEQEQEGEEDAASDKEGYSLQQRLDDIEKVHRSDPVPVPFHPQDVSQTHYLHSGRGSATLAGNNLVGIVQDRIHALTNMRMGGLRHEPSIARRMMRGGLVSLRDEAERTRVEREASLYAARTRVSASAVRRKTASGSKAEHAFAPLDEAATRRLLDRHVRGVYTAGRYSAKKENERKKEESRKKMRERGWVERTGRRAFVGLDQRFRGGPVLEHVVRTALRNGTYLDRDITAFAEQVRRLVPREAKARSRTVGEQTTRRSLRTTK